jgi:urate oxidase/2-oxo-4-hydroxy-4-carboxy-5-ureidoimidazoline decarboxylase
VERFASGWKRHYYGKGDVSVYRLFRDRATSAAANEPPVFGANVTILVYGDAFWPTYTTGDNSGLIATDSMKNFVQRETLDFRGSQLEDYCRHLGRKFLDKYHHVEGVQVSAVEIPYAPLAAGLTGEAEQSGDAGWSVAFAPGGPEQATAQVEIGAKGLVDVVSGLRGFKLLRLAGSAFHGFVRDEYTTLPDLFDRPLHMWLDLEWRYVDPQAAFEATRTVAHARRIVREVFEGFESGSIQQVIYQMGTTLLNELRELSEVHLEANNRTWDTIAERGRTIGVYTDPRPPFGCLGLCLRRDAEGALRGATQSR